MLIRDLLTNGDGSKIAVNTIDAVTTYTALADQVDRLAKELATIGLREGDRIAIALPNGLEVIATFLAASTVGTAAPLNPAYTVDEFKFYLEDTHARALIVPSGGAQEARTAAQETNVAIIECVSGEGS